MSASGIDEPIAIREITLRIIGPSLLGDFSELKFRTLVWKPSKLENGAFSCEHQIEGLPSGDFPRTARGLNSFDALEKALEAINIVVNTIPSMFHADPDQFECSGVPGLGARPIPDLVTGLHAYRSLEFSRALPLLLPFAEKGIAELECIVGSMFALGLGGVQKDVARAEHFFKASAAQGNGQAFWELSHLAAFSENQEERNLAAYYSDKAAQHGFLMHIVANQGVKCD